MAPGVLDNEIHHIDIASSTQVVGSNSLQHPWCHKLLDPTTCIPKQVVGFNIDVLYDVDVLIRITSVTHTARKKQGKSNQTKANVIQVGANITSCPSDAVRVFWDLQTTGQKTNVARRIISIGWVAEGVANQGELLVLPTVAIAPWQTKLVHGHTMKTLADAGALGITDQLRSFLEVIAGIAPKVVLFFVFQVMLLVSINAVACPHFN